MKIKKMFQGKKGSILAFSLIIMFVLMIIAAGVATVSVKERKMSSDTGKSTVAFQAADSGAEMALKKIKDGWTVKDFTDEGMACDGGVVSGNLSNGNGEYELTFKDSSDALITDCESEDTIASIKSVGKYGETHRAIEVAVAAGAAGCSITWESMPDNTKPCTTICSDKGLTSIWPQNGGGGICEVLVGGANPWRAGEAFNDTGSWYCRVGGALSLPPAIHPTRCLCKNW